MQVKTFFSFFQTPDNGPIFTFSYTPTRHPPLPRAQHGAEQHERTAWTSARCFRSRSFRRCFTSSARRSAGRSRSRLRTCSIAVAVACSSRNRRCSCSQLGSSITRKRSRRCCCCCSSCCCCCRSNCSCCSSCCCCCYCTHPTETSKYSTTTRSVASKHSSSTYESIRAAVSDAILTLS